MTGAACVRAGTPCGLQPTAYVLRLPKKRWGGLSIRQEGNPLSAPKERFSDRGKNPSLAADFTYERPGRRVRDLRTAERPLSAISLLTINKMTEGR